MPQLAYIGLGSNLGDRVGFLRQAVCALPCQQLEIIKISSLYESGAVGPVTQQPDFINAVAEIRTSLEASALLEHCLDIESSLGRTRQIPQGPRTIDLDLIMMGNLVLDLPHLTLPHPQMTFRAFVLAPLLEIAPHLMDPRNHLPIHDNLEKTRETQRITKLDQANLMECFKRG